MADKEKDDKVIRGGGEGDQPEAETREGAAQAGGYDSPHRPAPPEPVRNPVEPDMSGVESGDQDDGRIASQEGREAAGPFTGTGNQDAMRTAGREGATDAHHADQRTVEADSKDNTNKEADKATKESAKEQKAARKE